MDAFLFAMPPPALLPVQVVGIGLAILFAVFAGSRHSHRRITDEDAGRLGLLSLLVGPWIGFLFACRFLLQGEVRSVEFIWHLVVEGAAGSFAGWVAWTIFLLTAELMKRSRQARKPPGDVWDHEMDGGR